MKYLITFIFIAGLVNTTRFGDKLWNSESSLQARDYDDYDHSAPSGLFQPRNHLDTLLSPSYNLQRRADRRQRSPSPMARIETVASGPADMSIFQRYGKHRDSKSTSSVRSTTTSTLKDSLRMGGSLVGKIESTGAPSYRGASLPEQKLRAVFKGQTFKGRVSPPPGGRGNIRVEKYGKAPVDIPIIGTYEHHTLENYSSDKPGGLKVIATSDHGGKIKGEIYQRR